MYTNSQFYNLVNISDYHKLVIDYNNFESFTYIYIIESLGMNIN